MNKKSGKDPMPRNVSRKKLAEFWDTHSIADYRNELKPTEVRFTKTLSKGVTIRLDPKTLEELRAVADEKGIGPTTLARVWLLEHMKEIKGRTSGS